MNIDILKSGMVVMDGRTVLQITTVRSNWSVTAQIIYPVPSRTRVRTYTATEVAQRMKPCSDHMYDKAFEAYGAEAHAVGNPMFH